MFNIFQAYQLVMEAVFRAAQFCQSVVIKIPRSVLEGSDIVRNYEQEGSFQQRIAPQYWRYVQFIGIHNEQGIDKLMDQLDARGIVFDTGGNTWQIDWSFTIDMDLLRERYEEQEKQIEEGE